MRYFLLSSIVIINFSFVTAQSEIPGTLTSEMIKLQQSLFSENKIKTVLCYEYYEEPFDSIMASLYERDEYDEAGNKVKSTVYSGDSVVTIFQYDENGRLDNQSAVYDPEYPEYPEIQSYLYDENGKLTSQSIASGESRKYTFSHNKAGLIIKQNGEGYFPDDKGGLSWMKCENYTYSYDKSNRLTEVLWMFEPGYGLPRKMVISYNDKNQIISSTTSRIGESDKEWIPEITAKYEYDEKGFLKLMTKDNGDSNVVKYLYRYLIE